MDGRRTAEAFRKVESEIRQALALRDKVRQGAAGWLVQLMPQRRGLLRRFVDSVATKWFDRVSFRGALPGLRNGRIYSGVCPARASRPMLRLSQSEHATMYRMVRSCRRPVPAALAALHLWMLICVGTASAEPPLASSVPFPAGFDECSRLVYSAKDKPTADRAAFVCSRYTWVDYSDAVRARANAYMAYNALLWDVYPLRVNATKWASEAVRLNRDDAYVHYVSALALQKSNQLEAAISEAREALRINPDSNEAHELLASLANDGSHDPASGATTPPSPATQATSDKRASDDHGCPPWTYWRPSSSTCEPRIPPPKDFVQYGPAGEEALKKCRHLMPHERRDTTLTFSTIAACRTAADNIVLPPTSRAKAYGVLSVALTYVNRYEEAIQAGREAIRFDPSSTRAHFYLGYALTRVARYEESAREFTEAVRLEPENPLNHGILAAAYEKLDRLEDALGEAREAVRLSAGQSPEVRSLVNETFNDVKAKVDAATRDRTGDEFCRSWTAARQQNPNTEFVGGSREAQAAIDYCQKWAQWKMQVSDWQQQESQREQIKNSVNWGAVILGALALGAGVYLGYREQQAQQRQQWFQYMQSRPRPFNCETRYGNGLARTYCY